MKKLFVFVSILAIGSSCEADKKIDPAIPVAKISYQENIKGILVSSCAPCHLTTGTNPNKWEDYTTVKNKAASILDRIQREPGSAGFMPRNGTAKLSADRIALIKQWIDEGSIEK